DKLENQTYKSKNPYKFFNNFLIDLKDSEIKLNTIYFNFRKFTKIFNNIKNLNFFKLKKLDTSLIKNINFDTIFFTDLFKNRNPFDKYFYKLNNFIFFKKNKTKKFKLFKF